MFVSCPWATVNGWGLGPLSSVRGCSCCCCCCLACSGEEGVLFSQVYGHDTALITLCRASSETQGHRGATRAEQPSAAQAEERQQRCYTTSQSAPSGDRDLPLPWSLQCARRACGPPARLLQQWPKPFASARTLWLFSELNNVDRECQRREVHEEHCERPGDKHRLPALGALSRDCVACPSKWSTDD